MESLSDLFKWFAGPGLIALTAWWFSVRKKNRDAAAYDSGWERISKKERNYLDRMEAKFVSLEGDIKAKELEVSDLNKMLRERDGQILRLQFEKEALFHRHVKAGLRVAAALPAMQGVEAKEILSDTGFGELLDD